MDTQKKKLKCDEVRKIVKEYLRTFQEKTKISLMTAGESPALQGVRIMKATKRITNIIRDRHVMPQELATRFLIDGNIRSIRFAHSDIVSLPDDPFCEVRRSFEVIKKSGKYTLIGEANYYDMGSFQHKETTSHIRKVISKIKSALAAFSEDPELVTSTGEKSHISILKFAAK